MKTTETKNMDTETKTLLFIFTALTFIMGALSMIVLLTALQALDEHGIERTRVEAINAGVGEWKVVTGPAGDIKTEFHWKQLK